MASLGRLLALAALLALLVPAFELDRRGAPATEAPAPAPSSPPELPPAAAVEPSRPPGSAPAWRPRAPAPPAAALAAPPLVSLDDLLLPKSRANASRDLELDAGRAGSPQAATPRRRRVRVDFSRERPPGGVRIQTERSRTDVGVAVGIDEADRVRLRGGVRVDSRAQSEGKVESEASPTLGVDLRF